MEEYSVDPPDGGYGWVVVISAFFSMGLTTGILRNFGLFFLDIQNYYGVLTGTLSWVTSTSIAMFHLGAPLAGALSVYFTQRGVIMIGAVLAASGMIIASLSLSLPWMYLSLGVLQGLGCAFCWMPANSMVSRYFKRWRPVAFSISSSGECVFSMAFGPFFQWLIEAYSWRGALLIIGGLQLNLWVCGALMRPLKPNLCFPTPSQEMPTGGSKELNQTSKTIPYRWSLIRRPELLLYITFATLATAGFFIPPLFLVPHVRHMSVEQYWAASLLSILSLSDLLGRLVVGWLASLRLLRNLQVLAMAATMLGVVLLLLPLGQNYWAIVVFTALYGFLFGSMVSVHIVSIVDIVGLKDFDGALGLFMFVRSSGVLVALPTAGWLVDRVDDFSAVFYLAGVCITLSAVFVVVVDRMVEKMKRKKSMTAAGSFLDPSETCPINVMDHSEA
ncbi:monocarboxylate transporter 13 [Pygocentrus nattereri]|uniref:Major facilitator superfamily (MFS) profile domain-containing protein n=1 Tax=Pygocentrus nattereri TaxID=42514 RepID=A0A3B4DSX0_PYGNA|nr:monocarboxylate transporter 13 [Pygocentrus nattereri]